MKTVLDQLTPSSRLAALRRVLAEAGLDGFVVPRADEHLGEYVPACAERLAWLTGFTGSAGLAAVLAERAAVFTDGRYTLQLAAQTDPAAWERRHLVDDPPPAWLAAAAPGGRIGYDPWLMSEDALARYTDAGLDMVPVAENPVDRVWTDRPPPPRAPAVPHPPEYAGRSSAEKRAEVAGLLRKARHDAAVLTDPASVCWLFNIRGADVPYTPFALGFALLHADESVELFMDPAKLPPETRAWLGGGVAASDRAGLPAALARLSGRRVRVDSGGSPVWFAQALRAAGASVAPGLDPCALPKACKNPVEQQGAREAQRRDAVALCRFLRWLGEAVPAGGVTECSAAERLLAFRGEVPGFRGESFPAISGAGEDGAIIHHRATPETDRPIRPDEPYLIDSGAQYPDGTTDVTRTVWTGPGEPPAELRDHYTRVLKGHIALATAVFPEGVSGPHLDAFARRALWDAGLDYDHGTGHGVGSYLSVHEGPASLSRAGRMVPLAPGMILSDEPGYYRAGAYGIRLENLLLVQRAGVPGQPSGVSAPQGAAQGAARGASKPFLHFETLTLAPFDRRLIEAGMLSAQERAWVDAYHARVAAEVDVDGDAAVWLARECRAL